MNRKIIVVAAALAALSLSACSDLKQEIGIGRNSPDEFTVVKRAPLTLPPDYDLRPPMQGGAPSSAQATTQAKTVLMGTPAAEPAEAPAKGTAEEEFLKRAGADKANPSIRTVIGQDNGYLALKNEKIVNKLIFWNDQPASDADIPASVVDATKEAERLKKNQEEGKPVNSGDVPVIEHNTGTFGKIF
jgi:hypothetical protein